MVSDDLHNSTFPSLSTLTSIKESMLQIILLQCRLVQYRRAVGYSPLLAAWQEFFREFELDEVKVTYYSINQKWWIYERLGAWDKASHPSRTPAKIWSAAVAGKVSIPRLQITALCNELASSIGSMYFDFSSSEDDGELLTITTDESESKSMTTVESEPEAEAEANSAHRHCSIACRLHYTAESQRGGGLLTARKGIIVIIVKQTMSQR
jgi:hypothetical protein